MKNQDSKAILLLIDLNQPPAEYPDELADRDPIREDAYSRFCANALKKSAYLKAWADMHTKQPLTINIKYIRSKDHGPTKIPHTAYDARQLVEYSERDFQNFDETVDELEKAYQADKTLLITANNRDLDSGIVAIMPNLDGPQQEIDQQLKVLSEEIKLTIQTDTSELAKARVSGGIRGLLKQRGQHVAGAGAGAGAARDISTNPMPESQASSVPMTPSPPPRASIDLASALCPDILAKSLARNIAKRDTSNSAPPAKPENSGK